MQGKFGEAAEGFRRPVDLRPKWAQALATCADAQAMPNKCSREGGPEKFHMQAVKLDAANVQALSLAGPRQRAGPAPTAPRADTLPAAAGDPKAAISSTGCTTAHLSDPEPLSAPITAGAHGPRGRIDSDARR